MKKFLSLILVIVFGFTMLTACGKDAVTPDFVNEVVFETALNNNEDVTGKTVKISVDEINPNSLYGYNIYSGEHLNFVSEEKPNVKVGDKITVKITKVDTFLGSFIIYYEII